MNTLCDEDYIRQGSHPSKSKSVYITDAGMQLGKELIEKYGMADWNHEGMIRNVNSKK